MEFFAVNGKRPVSFFGRTGGMIPTVEEIAKERSDIKVGKINVDESPELAQVFGVMSIPTLISFKAGKPVAQIVGYRPKESILAMLDA